MSRCILFLALLTGCGATQYEYVRPWFRVATSPRYVIAPHALEWGGARSVEMLVDGGWRELPHSDGKRFRVSPVRSEVAVEEFTFVGLGRDPYDERWEASGVFVYHEGKRLPVYLSSDACRTPRFTPSGITCFACGDSPLYPDQQEATCGTLRVARYDTYGALLGRRALTCPIAVPDVEGALPDGAWVIAEMQLNPDFLYMYGPHVRWRLDKIGLARLPFGADPLAREVDAARRAKEILEEVPIRDATLMRLRGELIEDERARPGWVMQTEIVNLLRAGLSIEPRVSVRPGRCYAIIVRSTLPSIEVRVSRKRSSGSSFATVSQCVTAGDPPYLDFRLQANAGQGYVAARIYTYRPA